MKLVSQKKKNFQFAIHFLTQELIELNRYLVVHMTNATIFAQLNKLRIN